MFFLVPSGHAAVPGGRSGFLAFADVISTALQVDHMAQHIEASERSMQDRIQRLEAIRIALEEVRKDAPGALECSGSDGRTRCWGALWSLPLMTYVKIVMCCREEQKAAVYQLK